MKGMPITPCLYADFNSMNNRANKKRVHPKTTKQKPELPKNKKKSIIKLDNFRENWQRFNSFYNFRPQYGPSTNESTHVNSLFIKTSGAIYLLS